eukprot:GHVU01132813.1.p2 GENE.GHVU01132813.1~~GHVU01132813.1.p2  ORF type:complete len:184 (+),score=40.46 GHVU01132813.1:39-554(+)
MATVHSFVGLEVASKEGGKQEWLLRPLSVLRNETSKDVFIDVADRGLVVLETQEDQTVQVRYFRPKPGAEGGAQSPDAAEEEEEQEKEEKKEKGEQHFEGGSVKEPMSAAVAVLQHDQVMHMASKEERIQDYAATTIEEFRLHTKFNRCIPKIDGRRKKSRMVNFKECADV